jgi:ubiquinone/menaquinone biosynthesis C-methylase UbiE
VQVDADLDRDPDVQADMGALPFGDATFDTVVFDPPWKIGYYQRQTPFFEAVRVTKPGGKILMNALWVAESENTRITDTVVRADDEWANISVIVEHTKQPGQTTL